MSPAGRLADTLARVTTEVLSPFVVLAAVLVLVAVDTDPHPARSAVVAAGAICVIPQVLSLVMTARGLLADRFIYHRRQRHLFYALSLGSMLCGAVLLWVIPAAHSLRLAASIAVVTLLAVMVANLRIKVSIHALAAALAVVVSPVHAQAYLPWPVVLPLGVTIWGLVCFARVHQRRHSPGEVLWGSAIGGLAGLIYLALSAGLSMPW